MVNYNGPLSYKACRKKQYEIWMCKPPVGTVIINKLEQYNVVQALYGKTFFTLGDLTKNSSLAERVNNLCSVGQAYKVGQRDVVLCGTRGELMVTSVENVQKEYQVCVDGTWGSNWSKLSTTRGIRVGNELCIPWIKIRSCVDDSLPLMACFVPYPQSGVIQTYRANIEFNGPGVDHGYGDFIVCPRSVLGVPDFANRWVVNGAVFADTYNNQGWTKCVIKGNASVTVTPPALFSNKPVEKQKRDSSDNVDSESVKQATGLLSYIRSLAEQCSKLALIGYSFVVSAGEKSNQIKLYAVSDVSSVGVSIYAPNTKYETTVSVYSGNYVRFSVRQMIRGTWQVVMQFTIPGDHKQGDTHNYQDVVRFLKDNASVIFGLCGFINASVVDSGAISSTENQAIMNYLQYEDVINGVLTGTGDIDDDRCSIIHSCDRALSETLTAHWFKAFRGEPYGRWGSCLTPEWDNGSSCYSVEHVNYMSATLNALFASRFANGESNEIIKDGKSERVKGGTLWVLDVPAGIKAMYTGDLPSRYDGLAELLFDRCYDIMPVEHLFDVEGAFQGVHRVVRGKIVNHAPGGEIGGELLQDFYERYRSNIKYDLDGRLDISRLQ